VSDSGFVERRACTLFALLVSGIALLGFTPSGSATQLGELGEVSAQEQSVFAAINRARASHGLPPLRIGARLQRAARVHSREMLRTGSFSHGDWYRRLRLYGVRGRTFGETIAWGAGSDGTAASIVGIWLASPSHRATLLRRGFRRIGVGLAVGSFSGFPGATVATADFSGP
jgi:uncharacterized protein YkwD